MTLLSSSWIRVATAFLLSEQLGCGADAAAPGASDQGGAPPGACAPGQVALPDGGCRPAGLPPDMPCPPAEALRDDGTCQPAGVPPEACAEGFAPNDQRGCDAILPPQPCPQGQMAVPGETTCREVAPCGTGPYGDIPVDATTQFVDGAYTGGDSDGSRERPWTTIQEGVDAAAPDAIVAVAAGRYAEAVQLDHRPVRLWGRCPALAGIAGSATRPVGILIDGHRADTSEVRGFSITAPQMGIQVDSASSVVLDQLWVHTATGIGVAVFDGVALPGVTLSRSLIERNLPVGVLLSGGDATVASSCVRDTAGDGRGVDVEHFPATSPRGSLTVLGSLIERNQRVGVFVGGSSATVEATVVRETNANGAVASGDGVHVRPDPGFTERGTLVLRRSIVERNNGTGITLHSAEATIEDAIVRGTVSGPDRSRNGPFGQGIRHMALSEIDARGTLMLRSSLVEQNASSGILIQSSDATIESTIVRDTQLAPNGQLGQGIEVAVSSQAGGRGSLTLRASLLERNHQVGVLVTGSDATIDAVVVRDQRANDDGAFGRGIAVQGDRTAGERGVLKLGSSLIEQNREVGVLIQGSDATVESSVVRDTAPSGLGTFGEGIQLQLDANSGERGAMTLRGSVVERSHDVGVYIIGADATIESSAVQGTQLNGMREFADGILVNGQVYPSRADVSSTAVVSNARVGALFVESAGTLSSVLSSSNRIGLVLQGKTQPTLGEGVVFEGNTEHDRILDGDLAVPDAATPLP